MLDYLRTRAAALSPAELRARVRAAADELDAQLAPVNEPGARAHPMAGEWSIAEVVDHVAQTQIRADDELRHLLDGRRPPAPPVYEALTSGAAARASWEELMDGLRSANALMDARLDAASRTPPPPGGPTARTILVVNRSGADAAGRPEIFSAELDWKAYALVQRLHLLDHRTQVRALRAALARSPA
jgi:hypothetical protein